MPSKRKEVRSRELGEDGWPPGNVTLEPGVYWLLMSKGGWGSYKKHLREENGQGLFRTTSTIENSDLDEVFVIIDVSKPISVNNEVVKYGEYKAGDTPETLGLWEQESPSIIHHVDDIVTKAGDYAGSVKGMMWAGAAFTIGLALLLSRKK